MSIFAEIKFGWDDKTYVIPADRVLGAIAEIEDVVTFPEMSVMFNGKPNVSKLAQAFGALLRYAGAKIDDDQVYVGMFKSNTMQDQVAAAMNTLALIVMPPSAVAGAASEGNVGRAKTARSRLSKPSSKRRSAAIG